MLFEKQFIQLFEQQLKEANKINNEKNISHFLRLPPPKKIVELGFLLREEEEDARDHQHPHRPSRDPSRELVLGALLPRTWDPARRHDA